MAETLEHIVSFDQGYDCIKFECRFGAETCKPHTGGSHGRKGLSILFIAKGPDGAVHFYLSTDFMPQCTAESGIGYRDVRRWGEGDAMPADLGYHSKTPHYDGQQPSQHCCDWCDGEPCYCDGSILNASDAMYALVNGGGEALWAFLDGYYATVFHDAEYPTPAEYPMPLRTTNQDADATKADATERQPGTPRDTDDSAGQA